MNVNHIPSTNELRKMQKVMRRQYRSLKFKDGVVQVTRAGGHYKARYEGQSDAAFGIDPHQAAQRLRRFATIF